MPGSVPGKRAILDEKFDRGSEALARPARPPVASEPVSPLPTGGSEPRAARPSHLLALPILLPSDRFEHSLTDPDQSLDQLSVAFLQRRRQGCALRWQQASQ